MSTSSISILSSEPRLEHERFAAHAELEALLKKSVRGEVSFDLASRAIYSCDSSNYRQLPIGVVTPLDAEDVEAAVAACRATGAAILPRGAGTSAAGQTANVAVVFDYSRHMNALTRLDPASKLATVQPGIVLDRLREAAEVHHLTYAPDPATHSRCTLGGMIGNNSCGVHGLLGGKVVDNIESLDVVLYDGTRMTLGRTSPGELARLMHSGGRIGEIYSGLVRIRDKYADLIRKKFPRIPRRVSGFNLDELLPENDFHVARAIVGSEGTCANIVSATLNLSDSPPHRILVVLAFPDAFLAADAVMAVLEHKPIGLEGFDRFLADAMRKKGLHLDDVALLPEGGGFLLVEIGDWDASIAHARAQALVDAAQRIPAILSARIYAPNEAVRIWRVRDSGMGATVFIPGQRNGYEGWEDAAVPPARMGDYLRKLTALMNEYGYTTPLYGHFGQGCAHMRPTFDFHSEKGIRDFRSFVDRAADLVVSFGGSLSGEHGDGQARAALLPKMFGPELVEAFREFKAVWDPANRMNPGKLSDAVRVYDPIENLKYAPLALGTVTPTQPETHFVFAADNGSFESATERCVGVGACRNTTGGVMCPSYRATGDEMHSTRGRARLLWEMLAGALQKEGFRSKAVLEALDLCLSCKACKTECPIQVDITAWKAEFLAQHYKGRPHPIQHYIFGFADRLARMGSFTPALTNAILTSSLSSPLVKRLAGIASQRQLPSLAPQSFQNSRKASKESREAPPAPPQVVLLWPDTWNNYYHPQTLAAAEQLLTEAGFRVEVPRGHICCGRPLYDFGLLPAARAYLANVLRRMAPQIDAGLPFIFLEPSCASVFKDELPELFPDDERALKLRSQVWLLADWLQAKAPNFVTGRLTGAHILIHGHCHHKAVFGGPASEIALLRKAGASVELIDSSCCGMAGPFGFEADKFELSRKIAEASLLPAVRAAAPTTLIVADGFSCREQIGQLSERTAEHFAEALAHSCRCGHD
ncbi:MAG: FAD-binding and (Fe-S)-binding domain-containing protein [Terracidiphilus sp.]|nr:FAD-binding and (Fe-S)-binding domain-containing protein [Terracidiphilus sp.]